MNISAHNNDGISWRYINYSVAARSLHNSSPFRGGREGSPVASIHERILGNKQFEISNHLGNVISTISDRKLAEAGIPDPQTGLSPVTVYYPQVISAQDYYAFGAPMPGRSFSEGGYRFGFNGKENDNEVFGAEGTFQDYGMRMYDTRVGRFISVDPIFRDYPWNSTYAFAENDIVRCIDLDGMERVIYNVYQNLDGSQKTIVTTYTDFPKLNENGVTFKKRLLNEGVQYNLYYQTENSDYKFAGSKFYSEDITIKPDVEKDMYNNVPYGEKFYGGNTSDEQGSADTPDKLGKGNEGPFPENPLAWVVNKIYELFSGQQNKPLERGVIKDEKPHDEPEHNVLWNDSKYPFYNNGGWDDWLDIDVGDTFRITYPNGDTGTMKKTTPGRQEPIWNPEIEEQ